MAHTTITGGTSRTAGQSWSSPNGLFQLILQANGDVVYYDWTTGASRALLVSNTLSPAAVRLTFQADGNLVAYQDASGNDTRPLWSTGTFPYSGATLQIDDAGPLTIVASDGTTIIKLVSARTEVQPNEGKDWVGHNAISGANVYEFLYHTKSIGNPDSTKRLAAVSTLAADVQEVSGLNYSRWPVALGAMTNGVLRVPSVTWTSSPGWPSDVTGWGLSPLPTGGVAIYLWDFTGAGPPYDMSAGGSQITIPQTDLFFFNPGEA